MAKYESTAINDLIHVTQGRLPEPGGPDPADGLFVTKPPPPASFVPVAAYFDPCALTTPVPQVSSPPPPLPRRRAPNATPPVVPIHHDDEDDEEETTIDPNVMAKFATAGVLSPLPFASPIPPKPILPHYAIPSPVPLPPAPYVTARGTDRTPRVPAPAPMPVPAPVPVSAPMPAAIQGYPVVQRSSSDALETHRVAPLPALALGDPPIRGDLSSIAKTLAIPFIALVVVLTFVGRHLLHAGDGDQAGDTATAEAPVVMTATPPPAPSVAAAPVAVSDAAPPTVSAMGDTIGWKPRDVKPTLAAKVEPIAEPSVEPISEPAAKPAIVAQAESEPEIEMDAVPVVTQKRARRVSSSKRPAPKQVAAAVPAPKAAKPARAAKPAKAEKPAKAAKVAKTAAPVDDDPIAAVINAPSKTRGPKATGPGKVTITSSPSALIYVDGRSINKMTPQILTLPEGPHKITLLELSSRKAKTVEITVEAGATTQIAKKL